jgi:DNA-binding NarL/FixJ family response regulator
VNALNILIVGDNRWLIKALRLMIEGEPELAVMGTCSIHEVGDSAQRLQPDSIIFLPEFSFALYHPTLIHLHKMQPNCKLVIITPVDADIYETNLLKAEGYVFISHSKLHTDLLPKLKFWSRKSQETEHEQ